MPGPYFKATSDNQLVQVTMSTVLGDCLLALIDAGIDEDAHHWDSAWRDLDDDDLEAAINNVGLQATMIEYARITIVEKMKQAVAERRAETQRHVKGKE